MVTLGGDEGKSVGTWVCLGDKSGGTRVSLWDKLKGASRWPFIRGIIILT